MTPPYLTLQPSEQTIVTAAAVIRIAKVTDETVQADRELD